MLIDEAIPADRKFVQKEAEKKLKDKGLCIDIKRMRNMKCMIIPVAIRTTGIVTKGWKKYVEAILGKHRLATEDTWNIINNAESAAVWNLKSEWWGSPLIQEKYREEKAFDKRQQRHNNNNNNNNNNKESPYKNKSGESLKNGTEK